MLYKSVDYIAHSISSAALTGNNRKISERIRLLRCNSTITKADDSVSAYGHKQTFDCGDLPAFLALDFLCHQFRVGKSQRISTR